MISWDETVVDAKAEIEAGRHINAIRMMTSLIEKMSQAHHDSLPHITAEKCEACGGSGKTYHECSVYCPSDTNWDCPKYETCRGIFVKYTVDGKEFGKYQWCDNGKRWPGTETKELIELKIGDVLVEADGCCLPIVGLDVYSKKSGTIHLADGTEIRIANDSCSTSMIRVVKKEG